MQYPVERTQVFERTMRMKVTVNTSAAFPVITAPPHNLVFVALS